MMQLDDLLNGVSLREIERRGGVSRVTIERWRKGEHKPRRDGIAALARALGLDPATVAQAARNTFDAARAERVATGSRGESRT